MEHSQSENKIIPIDIADALERIGGDRAFLDELLNLYSEEFQLKFDDLRKAIDNEDFKSIQELGHSLKGSSANLSLLALQKASYEMEMAAREQNLEKAKSTLLVLEMEFKKLNEFLANPS